MTDDMKIIRKIEEQTEKKLKPLPLEDIKGLNNCYTVDNAGNVVGLNLSEKGIGNLSLLRTYGKLSPSSLLKNKIKDLTLLSSLANLKLLYLYGNQITDLTPLSALTNLTVLDLCENQITDLTPLRKLTQLQILNLEKNQIKDLMPLRALTNLRNLRLGNNQIEDINPLAALTHLNDLVLYWNHISDISPLSGLIELNSISLSSNNIIDLSPLIPLTRIKTLWLNKNNINDLTPLKALKQLEVLGVRINAITDLTPLKELTNLKGLDISNNKITKLSPDIDLWLSSMEINCVDKPTNEGLNLFGNPLNEPPIEIVKKGRAAIQKYFAEIERKASVFFMESKLLLVGSGDVGKTTLMKKLKNNKFKVVPGKEDTTRGIDIQPWLLSCPFPDGLSHDVKIHFWDFGGQDILHATHQFFLTKRSLYIFVWDPRKDEETRSFDYWLNAVKLLGAGSPVIVVMNKADVRIKHLDEASYKKKFPNLALFLQVSCVNGLHIPELTAAIRTAFSRMPHLLDKLPKRWMDIRDELKARPEYFITLEDYFAVCRTRQMEEEKALFLSDYLHDLGIILHFRHDPVLADTVILKPEWATGAVYALIDSLEIQQNKGRFHRADLCRYWDREKYPKEKYPQLLRLLEKFELCFPIVGTDDYILPELLPTQPPTLEAWDNLPAGSLQLHYSYDFMPAGIVTRFISRLHYLIRQAHYWKNGVELEFSGSTALVKGDEPQKRIRVSVSGTENSQLLGVIRSHFDHIHETLNMKKEEHVFEEVPCPCSACLHSEKPVFYKFSTLQKYLSKGKEAITCEQSVEDVSVHQLLHGLLPPRGTGKLFDNLVTVGSQVQGIGKTLQPDENSRNTVVALLLGTRGFHVKDQTLWGFSATGERIGELDIKIEDERGRAESIIEALNLDSLETGKIDRHIMKLLRYYDINGLKENYILVYASAQDFVGLCQKYRDHLDKIDYEIYPLQGKIEEIETGYNKIRAYRACHRCNTGETVLYHLLADMAGQAEAKKSPA